MTKRGGVGAHTPPVIWSGWADLNCQPFAPHANALANCATPRGYFFQTFLNVCESSLYSTIIYGRMALTLML